MAAQRAVWGGVMSSMCSVHSPILSMLGGYRPQNEAEAADVARVRALLETAADPWLRSIPLHVTASALVVHPGRRPDAAPLAPAPAGVASGGRARRSG